MRKILLISLGLILLTSACTPSSRRPENMPQTFIDQEKERIADAKELVKEDPQNQEAMFDIAYGYDQLYQYSKAIKYYKKTLEIDAGYYPAYNNLAVIYEKREKYEDAAAVIKTYYELAPVSGESVKDTVRILLKNGEPENALMALEFYTSQKRGTDNYQTSLVSDLFEQINSYESQE